MSATETLAALPQLDRGFPPTCLDRLIPYPSRQIPGPGGGGVSKDRSKEVGSLIAGMPGMPIFGQARVSLQGIGRRFSNDGGLSGTESGTVSGGGGESSQGETSDLKDRRRSRKPSVNRPTPSDSTNLLSANTSPLALCIGGMGNRSSPAAYYTDGLAVSPPPTPITPNGHEMLSNAPQTPVPRKTRTRTVSPHRSSAVQHEPRHPPPLPPSEPPSPPQLTPTREAPPSPSTAHVQTQRAEALDILTSRRTSSPDLRLSKRSSSIYAPSVSSGSRIVATSDTSPPPSDAGWPGSGSGWDSTSSAGVPSSASRVRPIRRTRTVSASAAPGVTVAGRQYRPDKGLFALRSARTFLVRELGPNALQRRSPTPGPQRDPWGGEGGTAEEEERELWMTLQDGVLLCRLFNGLYPGSIPHIDRRDVGFVKLENISKFLHAAKEYCRLKPHDLFQTTDLFEGSSQGLERVVNTIVAVSRTVSPSLAVKDADPEVFTSDVERDGPVSDQGASPKPSQESRMLHIRYAPCLSDTLSSTGEDSDYFSPRRSVMHDHSPQDHKSFSDSERRSVSFAPEESGLRKGFRVYGDRKMSESAIDILSIVDEDDEALQQPKRAQNVRRSSLGLGQPPPLVTAKVKARRHQSLDVTARSAELSTSLPDGFGGSSESRSGFAAFARNELDGPPRVRATSSNLGQRRPASLVRSTSSPIHSLSPEAPTSSNQSPLPSPVPSLVPSPVVADTPRIPFPKDPASMIDQTSSGFTSQTPEQRDSRTPRQQHKRWNSDLYMDKQVRPAGAEAPLRSRHDSLAVHSDAPEAPSGPGPVNGVRRSGLERSISTSTARQKIVVREPGKPPVTYQLGECIGRGQFGSVYRALNLTSGHVTAVKRIRLEGKTEDEIMELAREVALLKSLAHPSVVKYEGLVRTQHYLNIILEYVENGSLLHTLKAFGNLPEGLVASYVVKILEGLDYLHSQHVVHCDLKAANILTTKNGNIKLSDFGVSLNLKAVQNKNDVSGTPNWMAPEVIELKGASTASDIWSLACTIIELVTGKPPYGDLIAMSAMFRIVEEERPPIPSRCSPELRDFLSLCFRKDPVQRPTAVQLFGHEWLKKNWDPHKDLRPQDSVPFLRRISAGDPRRLDMDTNFSPSTPSMDRSASSPGTSSSPLSSMPNSPRLGGQDFVRIVSSDGDQRRAFGMAEMEYGPPKEGDLERLRTPPLPELAVSLPSAYVFPKMSPLLKASTNSTDTVDGIKSHSFVKSTFSKAVECKLCRQPVKRHAVLCEDCGLICHTRCAEFAPLACDLRAQLLSYSRELGPSRPLSPQATTPSGLPIPPPTAPPVSSQSSKWAIGKRKNKLSISSSDAGSSVTAVNVPVPSPGAAGESPPRPKRSSIIPDIIRSRTRSPDPRGLQAQVGSQFLPQTTDSPRSSGGQAPAPTDSPMNRAPSMLSFRSGSASQDTHRTGATGSLNSQGSGRRPMNSPSSPELSRVAAMSRSQVFFPGNGMATGQTGEQNGLQAQGQEQGNGNGNGSKIASPQKASRRMSAKFKMDGNKGEIKHSRRESRGECRVV